MAGMDDFAEEEVVENPTLRAAYNMAPLHQNQPLCWDYEVQLKGQKIYDKMIHLCETCELPILVYGRLLPCKHIFCFDCARKCDKSCKRCSIKVQKVEKSALGTVYVCTHGAPKHCTKGCRRTYLSHRDLQAHIAHRHTHKENSSSSMTSSAATPSQPVPNQLPLTKQQAAQQASQKQVVAQDMSHVSPGQFHHLSSVLPVQNSLVPQMTNLPLGHQQSSGMSNNSQQLSPAPPLISGLSDLRPIATVSQSVMGQNSPLIQQSPNPNNLSQRMNLPYDTACQPNPDIFHPLEMSQQQQMQQAMGIPGSHMQPNQTHQSYLQPTQFPQSAMMQQMNPQQMNPQQMNPQQMNPQQMNPQQMNPQQMNPQQMNPQQMNPQQMNPQQMNPQQMNPQQMNPQQMNPQQMNAQQLSSTVAASMHPNSFPHSHPSMSGSENLDGYNEPISQPQTNVNLITVPIQDEGQYRPLPYINSSLAPHPNSPILSPT